MIDVKNVSKRYGGTMAVRDVSFSVEGEQVLGFLGPNGAGKTTVMKILTGYHYPTSGEVTVNGLSVQGESVAVKEQVGYLPEMAPLYGELSVDEYLAFCAAVREVPKNTRTARIGRAIEACGLGEMRSRRIETLSKGFRQRTGLAGAIMHDPPILILDEPTTGLDPNQIIEIRELIKELGKSKTVILSTHILQEVEAICSQVLILNDGRIAAKGTPEEIALSMKGGLRWQLCLKKGAQDDFDITPACGDFAKSVDGWTFDNIAIAPPHNGLVDLSFFAGGGITDTDGSGLAESIFNWVVSKDMKILGMTKEKRTLEDIFVQLTSGGHGETPKGAQK
jgi:ABC-2 type transport system ATP-binding protein